MLKFLKVILFFIICAAIGVGLYWIGHEYGIGAAYVGGIVIGVIGITRLEPQFMGVDP